MKRFKIKFDPSEPSLNFKDLLNAEYQCIFCNKHLSLKKIRYISPTNKIYILDKKK